MTDYFALLAEARRPWLEPEKLKEKYYELSRTAAPDAEINEAFRVLSDPKLRLHHLLTLEGAELTAGRPVPPSVAELSWNTGALLREIDRWLLRNAEATSALGRALLSGERAKLAEKLRALESQLNAVFESELDRLREIDEADWADQQAGLIELHDSISYLMRLRAQVKEKELDLTSVA
jgi:curved DNA-binding protein CbpA